ncbi:MAG: TadE rane protein [Acidimicrobiaceae bacterium]|nr:TadE rane protein [Acidimicrobiaceae bacterium]
MNRSLDDQGSATLELAILGPGLLLLLALVIAAGRVEVASSAVEQAAASGARDASLARSLTQARTVARQSVTASLGQQHITCQGLTVSVANSGFAAAPGTPATVRVDVTCSVPLSDLGVPGLPGSRTLRASMSSVVDTYRSR